MASPNAGMDRPPMATNLATVSTAPPLRMAATVPTAIPSSDPTTSA